MPFRHFCLLKATHAPFWNMKKTSKFDGKDHEFIIQQQREMLALQGRNPTSSETGLNQQDKGTTKNRHLIWVHEEKQTHLLL